MYDLLIARLKSLEYAFLNVQLKLQQVMLEQAVQRRQMMSRTTTAKTLVSTQHPTRADTHAELPPQQLAGFPMMRQAQLLETGGLQLLRTVFL